MADGPVPDGTPEKALDSGLLEFEEGILSRMNARREEMNEWILWSAFSQARIHAAARRYRRVGDVHDIASDARLALLRSLERGSSPLLRWDGRRGSGFWPTVFRNKVRKAVEPLLRRRSRQRQVLVDQLACDRAEARIDRIPPELWAEVMEAVAKLAPRLRYTIRRIRVEGVSYSKAAQILGIDRHMFSRWEHEAIDALRLMLNSDA